MTSPSRSADESVSQPHSPLPWTLGDDGLVRDVAGRAISGPVDSAFAVLAVNHHDWLVAALREVLQAGTATATLDRIIALLAEIESAER